VRRFAAACATTLVLGASHRTQRSFAAAFATMLVLGLVATGARAAPEPQVPAVPASPVLVAPPPIATATTRATSPVPTSLAMRPPASAHNGFTDDMDCSACHSPSGWQLAATAGASGFDHERTGFPLRGAHVQTRCTGCHTGRAKPITSCDGCHRDPHRGRNDGTCAECHRPTAWSDTRALDQHRRTRMPLTGRHAMIDCAACHRRSGERAQSDVPADCYACHRPEYHAITVHPVHDGSDGGRPLSRDCGLCHRTSGWIPAIANPNALVTASARRTDHDARFALTTGSHRAVDCNACHLDPRRTRLVRCDGCHQDAGLRAQHRMPVSRSAAACLGCHPRGAAR
jgi:hypothetical protein